MSCGNRSGWKIAWRGLLVAAIGGGLSAASETLTRSEPVDPVILQARIFVGAAIAVVAYLKASPLQE